MHIQESGEMYLETIYVLTKKMNTVRSIDVCEYMGFSKPSVSVAMKNLRMKEHITVTDSGFIYLTDSGKAIAEYVFEKHTLIKGWLMNLGVPEDIAAEDACKIEHVISDECFSALKQLASQQKKDCD